VHRPPTGGGAAALALLAGALLLGSCGEDAQDRLATCDRVCGQWIRCGGGTADLNECRVTCNAGSGDPFVAQPQTCAACVSARGCPTAGACAADCAGVIPGRLPNGGSGAGIDDDGDGIDDDGDGLIDEDDPGGSGPGIDDDGDGIDDDGDGEIDEDGIGFGLDDDGDGIDDDLDGFTDEDSLDGGGGTGAAG